jgi:HUS1 checkpoint protein
LYEKERKIILIYLLLNQSDNRIAFAADVSLLHRALRSALTIHMQSQTDPNAAIQIKLVKKLPVGAQTASPYLTFETKGLHAAVVQDVPISKPLSRADLLQLQSVLDSAQELPQVNCSKIQ